MTRKRILTLALTLAALLCLCLVPALAADTEDAEIDYNALDNETAVFTYLTRELGLNTAAACGVMANIEYESGFDPTAWGDGGASHGLCQWYSGRCDRLSWFCAENGYDSDAVFGQMAYLQYELENDYPWVLEALLSVSDDESGAYDAAWCWCCDFEIPADTYYQASIRGDLAVNTYYPAYADCAETGEDTAEAATEEITEEETTAAADTSEAHHPPRHRPA